MLETVSLLVGLTFLCMLSPGPDMVLVMRNTLAGDRTRGLVTSLGILTGNTVHMAYCALGVGWLIARSVVVYSVVKYAGAAYLIYLGLSALRARAHGAPGDGAALSPGPRAPHHRRAYFQGLLNNLLNAKGALFYLGVFTQIIAPDTVTGEALVLIVAMLLTSALFWLAFVHTLHLPPVRDLITRFRVTVERVFGALLVLLGLRVAASD